MKLQRPSKQMPLLLAQAVPQCFFLENDAGVFMVHVSQACLQQTQSDATIFFSAVRTALAWHLGAPPPSEGKRGQCSFVKKASPGKSKQELMYTALLPIILSCGLT